MPGLEFESLQSIQGDRVEISDAQNNRLTLLLDTVEPSIPNDSQWVSFSIHFRSDTDVYIPQGHYKMHHEHLGSHMMFVVPRGSGHFQTMITRARE